MTNTRMPEEMSLPAPDGRELRDHAPPIPSDTCPDSVRSPGRTPRPVQADVHPFSVFRVPELGKLFSCHLIQGYFQKCGKRRICPVYPSSRIKECTPIGKHAEYGFKESASVSVSNSGPLMIC